MNTTRVVSVFFLIGLLSVGCTRRADKPQETSAGAAPLKPSSVSVKGSDTMVLLGQRWAEGYMAAHPGSSIQVTGGGSGTGIASLINGTTDVCESSRAMKDKERAELKSKQGKDAVEIKVALDALAVYVHASNALGSLSVQDVGRIYRGELTNWKALGGADHAIVLYGRENNSGTYGYFKEHVLENKDFAAGVQTLAGTSAVASAVKGDPYSIGYGGIAYLEGVKALQLKKDASSPAVAPNLQTAQSGEYPVSRPLFFYTAGPATGTAADFVTWVQGPDGQKVITAVGYYPLPK